MKKMVILLTLLIPVASWGHPIDTWIDKIIEYETANKRTNPALINLVLGLWRKVRLHLPPLGHSSSGA